MRVSDRCFPHPAPWEHLAFFGVTAARVAKREDHASKSLALQALAPERRFQSELLRLCAGLDGVEVLRLQWQYKVHALARVRMKAVDEGMLTAPA